MKKENHSVQTFDGVYEEMKQYFCITHTKKSSLTPEPKISDFYTPSEDQQKREYLFIVCGMADVCWLYWGLTPL